MKRLNCHRPPTLGRKLSLETRDWHGLIGLVEVKLPKGTEAAAEAEAEASSKQYQCAASQSFRTTLSTNELLSASGRSPTPPSLEEPSSAKCSLDVESLKTFESLSLTRYTGIGHSSCLSLKIACTFSQKAWASKDCCFGHHAF